MHRTVSQTPVIVCCDSLDEQARISRRLSQEYDTIIGCQLGQIDTLLKQEPRAQVVAGWTRPCAELRLIIDGCRATNVPLLVLVKQLYDFDINNLPAEVDYLLMPSDPQVVLKPWLEHATRLRLSVTGLGQEIKQLQDKLDERKMVEKAKGLLMKLHQVDEETAYRAMRKSAMESSQTMHQVAKNLLVTLETLG